MSLITILEGISADDFRKEFVAKRKAAIIRDATKKWKALTKWTPEFWKSRFGEKTLTIDNKIIKMKKLIDLALESNEQNPAPYYRNIRIAHEYPELTEDITPESDYCLPNYFLSSVFKPLRSPLFAYGQYELFIGGKGRAFPYLHYDTPGADTFIHQIYGVKDLVLFSPEDSKYLYPGTGAEFNVSSIPDIENVDIDKFPLFSKAKKIEVTLQQGESIYFPSGWWHTAKMQSFSISIGIDVANEYNWNVVENFLNTKAKVKLKSFSPVFMLYLKFARKLI